MKIPIDIRCAVCGNSLDAMVNTDNITSRGPVIFLVNPCACSPHKPITNNPNLELCPCGHIPKLGEFDAPDNKHVYRAYCNKCGRADSAMFFDKQDAIDSWNIKFSRFITVLKDMNRTIKHTYKDNSDEHNAE
jgi:hypothetical protein